MNVTLVRLADISAHLEDIWPGALKEDYEWTAGSIREVAPHFRVRRIAPLAAGDEWVYVSLGNSLETADPGVEFFIMSPDPTEWHVESLAMVSQFDSYPQHRLDVGSVVNIGRPWMSGSRMDRFLVSLPHPYGRALEWCSGTAGQVRFLWLLPIHESEASFIRREGLEKFEDAMESANVNILARDREPIF